MDRRACLLAFNAWLAVHCAARAQPARPLRIAMLNGATPDAAAQRYMVDPLRQGLAELGWVDGRNIELHLRWAAGQPERLPGLLEELLQLQPALLVVTGPRPTMVARDANVQLPVVAIHIDDPVTMKIAQSAAKPGGRFTGVLAAFEGLLQRRLQLLLDIVPNARRVAVLSNPATLPIDEMVRLGAQIEQTLRRPIVLVQARTAADFDAAFAVLARERVDGLAVLADATFYNHRDELVTRCRAMKLPAVWGARQFVEAGGLASYQGDVRALYQRAPALIDKVLKGTPPGDIPFEQGTKLELVINLRAFKALGLAVPASLRVSADEVIE